MVNMGETDIYIPKVLIFTFIFPGFGLWMVLMLRILRPKFHGRNYDDS